MKKIIDILSNKLGLMEFESMENHIVVFVEGEYIEKVCSYFNNKINSALVLIHANDERIMYGHFVVYYTFSLRENGVLVTFKTRLNENCLILKSITNFIPAAALYEREIRDMFGIQFTGHPDMRDLVFHENWPQIVNPLRKEYKVFKKPVFVERKQEFVDIKGEGVFEIPVGPVHAGVIEPGHFRFSVAGEPIINLEAKLYYVHKGIEKLAENQSFQKTFFLSERISGDETVTNSLAYCQALEKIAGLDIVPLRASYTRVVLAEFERIYNHIGDITGICVDIAYVFAAGQFGMLRRWVMMMNEELTGSRFLRSSIRLGGTRKDFLKGKEKKLLEFLNKLQKEFKETVEIIKSNSLYIDRVENSGVLGIDIARDLNAVGPAARASGVHYDVRKNFPYEVYERISFNISKHNNGDVNCRINVKIDEVYESIKIITQAIEDMPQEGKAFEKISFLEPFKSAIGMTESPRGENLHFIMTGKNNTIYRYKVRTPSFCNWPVLCHAVKGNIVPDFPLINKSFNLSYSGNDL